MVHGQGLGLYFFFLDVGERDSEIESRGAEPTGFSHSLTDSDWVTDWLSFVCTLKLAAPFFSTPCPINLISLISDTRGENVV